MINEENLNAEAQAEEKAAENIQTEAGFEDETVCDAGCEEEPMEEAAEESEGSAGEAGEGEPAAVAQSADTEELEARYKRLMADFQNFRRRTEKDKKEVYSFANEKIMTELLPVLDNFERALGQESQDQAYADGMALIFKQLLEVLTKSGLAEIDALGKEFDPNFHHAVLTDDNDQFGSGCVTEILQKGYTLKDKVIRPSMVKVNN